jgi:hypothetical protein
MQGLLIVDRIAESRQVIQKYFDWLIDNKVKLEVRIRCRILFLRRLGSDFFNFIGGEQRAEESQQIRI